MHPDDKPQPADPLAKPLAPAAKAAPKAQAKGPAKAKAKAAPQPKAEPQPGAVQEFPGFTITRGPAVPKP